MSKTLEALTASDLASNGFSESLAASVVHSWAKLLACLLTSNHCVSDISFTTLSSLIFGQEVFDIFGESGKYNQFVPNARLAKIEPYFVVCFLDSLKSIGQFDLFDRMKVYGIV